MVQRHRADSVRWLHVARDERLRRGWRALVADVRGDTSVAGASPVLAALDDPVDATRRWSLEELDAAWPCERAVRPTRREREGPRA